MTQWLRRSKEVDIDRSSFSRVQNIIIGDNKLAAQAALKQAEFEGFQAEILTNELQGEAREIGVMLAQRLRNRIDKALTSILFDRRRRDNGNNQGRRQRGQESGIGVECSE